MDYYQFMNSKVLFKEVRHKPAGSMAMPVMVHISELCSITWECMSNAGWHHVDELDTQ
jgi:hypothetical protein